MLYYSDAEQTVINSPDLIDGEYYSDILAFELSLKNHFSFLNAENAYDISVGSLSSKRFSIQQRLKFEHKLRKNLKLYLRYFEREDFELARQEFMAGLGYRVNKLVEISVHTSLFSQKSKNDIGFAADFYLNPKNRLQFFINFPDFAFNERNESESENLKQSLNFGMSSHHKIFLKTEFEFFLIRNTDLERQEAVTDTVYEFSETRAGLKLKSDLDWATLYFLSEVFEAEEGRYAMLDGRSVWNRSGARLNTRLSFENWIFGLEYNWRKWHLNGENVFHRNLMPHLWYSAKFNWVMNKVDFGLETSLHDASGLRALRSDLDKNADVNARFNLRLNFKISETSFLNLLFSLDLDDGSWEGGGGQFQALF